MTITNRLMACAFAASLLVLAGCQRRTGGETTTDTGGGEEVSREPGFGETGPASGNPTTDDPIEGEAARIERMLQPVFFAFDKYDLTQDSRDTLTQNARVLRDNPGWDVVVEGHCDERGTNEYNLALGDRRARAAKDFLVGAGVPSGTLTIVSYGEEKPFATGHDETSWRENRRAHFRVRGKAMGSGL